MPQKTVVVNTSPIIVLQKTGRLDILHQLYGAVIIPEAVKDEIALGSAKYNFNMKLLHSSWIKILKNPPETFFRKELGIGEAAVIALGIKIKADLLVLDDMQARLVAHSHSLKITGTLGVLIAAYSAGLVDNLKHEIDKIQDVGFHISPALKNQILSKFS